MKRTPHSSHTLILTPNRLVRPDISPPARIPQQHHLLQYRTRLHIADADRLFPAIDIRALDDRMPSRSGRDTDLDLWVLAREDWELGGYEGAGERVSMAVFGN